MAETRRKFDQDFKEGAVRLVRETGRPIAQVAKDLGINEGTLGNDHVTCAGRRVARGGWEAVGQDVRRAHHRLLMRFCRSSRPRRWTASSWPGTW